MGVWARWSSALTGPPTQRAFPWAGREVWPHPQAHSLSRRVVQPTKERRAGSTGKAVRSAVDGEWLNAI